MRQEKIGKPSSAWLGATIFSLLTGAGFDYGVFVLLFDSTWHGLFFIGTAIAFARVSWVVHPKNHKLQLLVTSLPITLALVFGMYLFLTFTPKIM